MGRPRVIARKPKVQTHVFSLRPGHELHRPFVRAIQQGGFKQTVLAERCAKMFIDMTPQQRAAFYMDGTLPQWSELERKNP